MREPLHLLSHKYRRERLRFRDRELSLVESPLRRPLCWRFQGFHSFTVPWPSHKSLQFRVSRAISGDSRAHLHIGLHGTRRRKRPPVYRAIGARGDPMHKYVTSHRCFAFPSNWPRNRFCRLEHGNGNQISPRSLPRAVLYRIVQLSPAFIER